MKKKTLATILGVTMAVSLFAAGCGSSSENSDSAQSEQEASENASSEEEAAAEEDAAEDTKTEENGQLMMATTTSTADTGLLDYLAPIFQEDTGYELLWDAVGTGEALEMGENGDVDIVLVHAKASEEEFVAEGYGVERVPVMYNDFIVVGPTEPIAATEDIEAVFTQIVNDQLPFISRGDDSGTDKKEKQIWEDLGLDPAADPNYMESGQGMGATLTMADEEQAYCLTDRGTYLTMKKDADVPLESEIVCEGDSNLLNQYGVIAVNPEKYPEVNNEAANAFIEWICSEEIQQLIGEYGVDEYGEALFVPNAGSDA